MMMQFNSFLVLFALLGCSEAFSVGSTTNRQSLTLHLLPTQGNQLVAASSCAYGFKDENDDDAVMNPNVAKVVSVATDCKKRSFVSRVFSLPSSMIRRHPYPRLEGLVHDLLDSLVHDDCKDGVLFPVVGFRYVKDAPDHSRPLATVSNVACRLQNTRNEEVVGWYSPACPINQE
jgi:hypothetical protein